MDLLLAFLLGMFFFKAIGRLVLVSLDWLTFRKLTFQKLAATVHFYDGEKLVGAGFLLLLVLLSKLLNW